jgi:formate dehydrogenase iron-sulfur subunit
MQKAILFNSFLCIGCRSCEFSCKVWHNLKVNKKKLILYPEGLNEVRWLTVNNLKGQNSFFYQRRCLHCNDAPCVVACPTGALSYHPYGFVDVKPEICNGCGFCRVVCPFLVPKFDGNFFYFLGKISICNFCKERLEYGEIPVCVKNCPTGALYFSERGLILAKAKEDIKKYKKTFPNSLIYGEKELKGLSFISILPHPVNNTTFPKKVKFPKNLRIYSSYKPVFLPLSFLALIFYYILDWRIKNKEKKLNNKEKE